MLDGLVDMDIADRAVYIGDHNGYNVFVAERSDGKTVFVGLLEIFYFVKGDDVREVTSDEPEGEEALKLLWCKIK